MSPLQTEAWAWLRLGCVWSLPLLAACQPAQEISTDRVAAMHQRCVAQMVAATCRASRDGPPPAATQVAGRVFVAGVGAIDGAAYDALRRQGDAMCATALTACRRDDYAPACTVAQQLWGDAPPGP